MTRRPPHRLLPALAMLVFFLPRFAPATTARVAALGGGAFIEDDSNVLRWYGSLVDYPDEALVEFGHFTLPEGWHDVAGGRVSGPGLGAHLRLDERGRWGTVAAYWHGHGDDVDPGSLERSRLGTTWTGMWARRFGAMQLAALLRTGSHEATTVSTTYNRHRTEYGLGVRWDFSPGAYLDLAGELRRHDAITLTTGVATPDELDRQGDGLGLRGRAFLRLGDATALVPLAEYLDEERPLLHPAVDAERAVRGHLFKVGAGLNWYPDADHFLVAGIDHIHGHRDRLSAAAGDPLAVRNGHRWDALALSAGFESRFRYWLVFRGSFRYETIHETTIDGLVDEDYALFGVNVGAACQLGPADLDLTLSDREPRAVAGYWGTTLPVDPSTWLTATFRWRF